MRPVQLDTANIVSWETDALVTQGVPEFSPLWTPRITLRDAAEKVIFLVATKALLPSPLALSGHIFLDFFQGFTKSYYS